MITSSKIMLRYIQRSDESMSTRHFPHFFETVLMLHKEKIRCFLSLSKGTDDAERSAFELVDLAKEIKNTLDRFTEHPEEEAENIPAINEVLFDKFPDLSKELTESGISEPFSWYRTKDGAKIVMEKLKMVIASL